MRKARAKALTSHGAAMFTGIKDTGTGKSIAAGKEVTGFSTEGDNLAGVLDKIHGDGFNTTEKSAVLAGARYIAPPTPFEAFSVSSGRIVTGANPASAHVTVLAAISAFDKS
jgi:putative intracellular protease/amidase